jgi:hypothetical protein
MNIWKKHYWHKLLVLAIIVMAMAIPVSVSAVTFDSSLTLDNKDTTTWARIADGKLGTLQYNASGATFSYSFSATGMENGVAYSLIYYANPYPGNNPGALIGVGTADGSGNVLISGSPNLGISLPTVPDSNMVTSHAGAPDFYVHPYGAKIWLVPSACYDAGLKKVITWSPARFLFETDLITYTDTDAGTGSSTPLTTTIVEQVATIGLSISPPAVNYGSVAIGACSADFPMTLTNTGNVPIKVTATTTAGFYTDCMKINSLTANGWISTTIPVGGNLIIQTKVCPTIAYNGTANGSISFIASFAP